MRILVLGSNGQLGKSLKDEFDKTKYDVIYKSRDDIDVSDLKNLKKNIFFINPDVVINASAYTAVDDAEDNKKMANTLNHKAVSEIASVCKELKSWFIHISTDYVFNGAKDKPYEESDQTDPQSVYGISKLNGEIAILKSDCKYIIIRTAWLFSAYGNNFLKTMMRLSKNSTKLNVVSDQVGSPTYAPHLANAIITTLGYLEQDKVQGIYHYAGTPSVSWAGFAIRIFDEIGLIDDFFKKPTVVEIKTCDYQTKAKRPANSVLNSDLFEKTFSYKASNWVDGIKKILHET